ncbi:hypothetical protein ACGFI3_13605 [Nonomuraea wenchangensis]|uniref:hypothetical protein n=1 Tax=Nonomuraea wenchangensis TaxID=568860 RepID=UPI0037201636
MTEASEAMDKRLAGPVELRDFLDRAGSLTLADRRALVAQALVLIEQNYVHLPLKVAMHAVNPVQRLRLLALRLGRQGEASMDPEWRFHAELSQIFHSVRDLHTNYLLPEPFAGRIAYLPYQVEEYYEGQERHYVVARVVAGFAAQGFGPGVRVTHWNGVPIDRTRDGCSPRCPRAAWRCGSPARGTSWPCAPICSTGPTSTWTAGRGRRPT